MVRRLGTDACVDAAGKFRSQVVMTRVGIGLQREDRTAQALEALRIATAQYSGPGIRLSSCYSGISEDRRIDDLIMQAVPGETFVWSLIAEDLANYLTNLSPSALGQIQDEASRRPERWQPALRLAIDKGGRSSPAAAGILAEIGSLDDAAFLREMAASKKALRPHALRIAQRLARQVSGLGSRGS